MRQKNTNIMKYKKFEELPIWQEARVFVASAYTLIKTSEGLKKDYSLSDQFKRASYSIMLNIAEGFERGSNKDFAHFRISKFASWTENNWLCWRGSVYTVHIAR